MTDPLDSLRVAVAAKVEEEMRPLKARFDDVTECLRTYSDATRAGTETRILNSILLTLGQPTVPVDPSLEETATKLRWALSDLLQLLGTPVGEARQPDPPPAADAVPAETANDIEEEAEDEPPSEVTPKTYKDVPPEVVDRANALMDAVQQLDKTTEHPIRLGFLLQILTCELRICMEQFPINHPLGESLGEIGIRGVNRIREEKTPETYVKGLAFGARYKWRQIIAETQTKLRQFDADAAGGIPSKKSNGNKPKSNPKNEPPQKPTYTWPELPQLRQFIESRGPVIIAGGIRKEDKIAAVQERFGVACEWHEIDRNNPRATDALATRIQGGKVSGIIMLEGLMAHKTSRKIEKAVQNQPKMIPIAFGDTGGIAKLGDALDALERDITINRYGIGTITLPTAS